MPPSRILASHGARGTNTRPISSLVRPTLTKLCATRCPWPSFADRGCPRCGGPWPKCRAICATSGANFGPKLAVLGPTSPVIGPELVKLTDAGPNLTNSGRDRPSAAQLGPSLADSRPTSADAVRARPKDGQSWPDFDHRLRPPVRLGRIRPPSEELPRSCPPPQKCAQHDQRDAGARARPQRPRSRCPRPRRAPRRRRRRPAAGRRRSRPWRRRAAWRHRRSAPNAGGEASNGRRGATWTFGTRGRHAVHLALPAPRNAWPTPSHRRSARRLGPWARKLFLLGA